MTTFPVHTCMDATELAALIRSKQLSPIEVAQSHLDRIEVAEQAPPRLPKPPSWLQLSLGRSMGSIHCEGRARGVVLSRYSRSSVPGSFLK
jgi:hypothetical protein